MEEKLIEAVRLRELLYDTSHEDYMRTKLKTEKWSEIANEVGMKTGTEAKALWEKLRQSLRDAIRRQQKSYKSGAPAKSIKEWRFHKQMGFLQPYMANKSREGNLPEEDDVIMTQDSTEVDNETVNIQDERVGDDEIQILPDNSVSVPPSSTSTLKTTPRSTKKK
ncbi:uncharacterized protein LOC108912337 [Anoplophora glabripennis]|uniref:uncharacterized protein LOC108912337 n=1 Tax=Anoplophora glabripennis TaxID=217634 RepID=UPI0008748071|nr:uncharacterized protein LOC108912337 [Anoplophora glabripennis]